MSQETQDVTVQIGVARITMPATAAVRAWLGNVLTEPLPYSTQRIGYTLPSIGSVWPGEGGIYAGVVRGDNSAADYHLIVADTAAEKINWKNALAWAKEIVRADGHHDFELPRRKEQAVLFGNVPELFEKEWYWSAEQSASGNDYAWAQHFDGGTQGSYRKTTELRARAVRRLPIQ